MGEAHTHLQLQACTDSQPLCSSSSRPTQSSAEPAPPPQSPQQTGATCSSEPSSATHQGLQLTSPQAAARPAHQAKSTGDRRCSLTRTAFLSYVCPSFLMKCQGRQECNHHPLPESSGHFLACDHPLLLSFPVPFELSPSQVDVSAASLQTLCYINSECLQCCAVKLGGGQGLEFLCQ